MTVLSAAQERAVRRLGQDVCLVAGPGSGKTRVLVHRFQWLVEDRGIPPSRILTITFTEKAAAEIKRRLVEEYRQRPELRRQVEAAPVSTVHAFCARLLRENAVQAGIDPAFKVLDEADAERLLHETSETVLDQLHRDAPEKVVSLLEALAVAPSNAFGESRHPDLAESLVDAYTAMRIAGCGVEGIPAPPAGKDWQSLLNPYLASILDKPDPEKLTPNQTETHAQLREWAGRVRELLAQPVGVSHFEVLGDDRVNIARLKADSAARNAWTALKRDGVLQEAISLLASLYYAPLRGELTAALQSLDTAYRQQKRAVSSLDFSDLEEAAISLLREREAFRDHVRSSFEFILMDEVQDTNPLQWMLLDLLRRPGRFFAVGDPNQSIFGFRHAQPAIFRGYRDTLSQSGGEIDSLHTNYRSRPSLLNAVNAVFTETEGIEPHDLMPPEDSPACTDTAIEILYAQGEDLGSASRNEACWLARRIRELEGAEIVRTRDGLRPAKLADMAILVRSTSVLPLLQEALAAFSVPFLLTGGGTFFDSRPVRDAMLWLSTLANPSDEVSLAGVLRSPLVGLSDESILRLRSGGPLQAALGSPPTLEDTTDCERLAAFSALYQRLRPLRDALSPDRLLLPLLDASGYEEILQTQDRANLAKLLAMLREERPNPLAERLEDLSSRRAAGREAEAPPPDSSQAVRLLTMHKAKGLEFPIVFVPCLQKGTRNTTDPLRFSPRFGLGARWRNPHNGEPVSDPAYGEAARAATKEQAGEEARLFYVAMTRAIDRLVLSYAQSARPAERAKRVSAVFSVSDPLPAQPVTMVHRLGFRYVLHAPESLPPLDLLRSVHRQPSPETMMERLPMRSRRDATVTVTSVALFSACPRRYYLDRYLGWEAGSPTSAAPGNLTDEPGEGEPPLSMEVDAVELGTLVHRLLAGEPADEAPPEAMKLASVFQSSPLGQRAERASRIRREDAFLVDLGEVLLSGQIDLWFEEGGELVLVDYKTDRGVGGSAAYSLQMRLYALALERLAGRLPTLAVLFYLRSGQAIRVDLSTGDLHEARAAVTQLLEAQDKVAFPLNPSAQCTRCPFYQGLCPVSL